MIYPLPGLIRDGRTHKRWEFMENQSQVEFCLVFQLEMFTKMKEYHLLDIINRSMYVGIPLAFLNYNAQAKNYDKGTNARNPNPFHVKTESQQLFILGLTRASLLVPLSF